MDFAAFATFVAAWEERGHFGAVKYFFQVLDLQGRGFLDQVRCGDCRSEASGATERLGCNMGLFRPGGDTGGDTGGADRLPGPFFSTKCSHAGLRPQPSCSECRIT